VTKSARKWLNPKKSDDSGAIQWYVSLDSYDASVNASFDVWDCSRKISIDLSYWNKAQAKERAMKIDIMIQELQAMREALADAYTPFFKHEDRE